MRRVQNEAWFQTSMLFLYQVRIHSQIIYSTTLLAIVFALGASPFLYITISVKSAGVIKTSMERIELLAPISGHVLKLNVTDNQKVIKGETLLIMDATSVEQQNIILDNYQGSLSALLNDAEKLIRTAAKWQTIAGNITTGYYSASWQQYVQQSRNAENISQQAERMYKRYHTLYHKDVVTQAEFEQNKFNYEQSISNQKMVNNTYKSQLQMEANQYRKELTDLQSQQAKLNEQQEHFKVKATVNGSIQNLTGLQEGAFIHASQKIGEISPDEILFAYFYIKPSDVNHIREGQSVRFQIDGFNYNQWGMLTGKIMEISDDTIIQNQQPYFKVKCLLNKNYLQLKSGYKGFIKKGMTFTTYFTLTKRSLYQLLYDKIDDWVD